jgi:ATP/maltotriose-dependent transcriptional regulator MalT
MVIAACRGREDEVNRLIVATRSEAVARGEGIALNGTEWATALLFNGLCRYEEALVWAREAVNCHGLSAPNWGSIELIEAAVRTGATDVATRALQRLSELTGPCGTDWALGIEARSSALVHGGRAAERLYREAIERLDCTRLRVDVARARLLFGEWLRREGRRVDSREQLRAAHSVFASIGMDAFAERARRELIATGEKLRKRSGETHCELTPQEAQIAGLARSGLSNPEIGSQLFISGRTVEWHLRNVFAKLGISSRSQLGVALSDACLPLASA